MGPIGRAQMAYTARANKSRAHEIPARLYAARNRNFKESPSHPGKSRELVHTGAMTDLEKFPPFCYGVKLAYVADDQERGPKGQLSSASPVGELVGVRGAGYRVLKSNGRVVERAPQHVRPLNEEALVDRGIPELSGVDPRQPSTPSASEPTSEGCILMAVGGTCGSRCWKCLWKHC